jgi:hypothetical protein
MINYILSIIDILEGKENKMHSVFKKGYVITNKYQKFTIKKLNTRFLESLLKSNENLDNEYEQNKLYAPSKSYSDIFYHILLLISSIIEHDYTIINRFKMIDSLFKYLCSQGVDIGWAKLFRSTLEINPRVFVNCVRIITRNPKDIYHFATQQLIFKYFYYTWHFHEGKFFLFSRNSSEFRENLHSLIIKELYKRSSEIFALKDEFQEEKFKRAICPSPIEVKRIDDTTQELNHQVVTYTSKNCLVAAASASPLQMQQLQKGYSIKSNTSTSSKKPNGFFENGDYTTCACRRNTSSYKKRVEKKTTDLKSKL